MYSYIWDTILVPESPGKSSLLPKSWIVREPAVFRTSYYGFSTHGSREADWLIALLHLLTHSDLFSYRVLLTGSKMGAERRTFLKDDIENFPFPKPDILSSRQKQSATNLSDQLEHFSDKPWEAINNFIFDLYGLDNYDRQVIRDTLEVGAPFKESRQRANNDPARSERDAFRAELHRLIAPFFSITNENVSIEEIELVQQNRPSWYFISIAAPAVDLEPASLKNLISQITREANKTGCSRVVVHDKGRLFLGIIGQYRYWTLSRARLCALDIMRHHLDHFPIGKN